jgi:hypothetical protein
VENERTNAGELIPDIMEVAIQQQMSILRSCLVRNKGYEVKTEGDGYFCAFSTAMDTANFLMEIQVRLCEEKFADKLNMSQTCATVQDENGVIIFRGLRGILRFCFLPSISSTRK